MASNISDMGSRLKRGRDIVMSAANTTINGYDKDVIESAMSTVKDPTRPTASPQTSVRSSGGVDAHTAVSSGSAPRWAAIDDADSSVEAWRARRNASDKEQQRLRPLKDSRDHMRDLKLAVEQHSQELCESMGMTGDHAAWGPFLSINGCRLYPPDTKNHISRRATVYFPNNELVYSENSAHGPPVIRKVPLRPTALFADVGYNASNWGITKTSVRAPRTSDSLDTQPYYACPGPFSLSTLQS